jgi:uncharacterized LabA/DUF88 family protein
MPEGVAILLDGEYVKKVFAKKIGRFPEAQHIVSEVWRIQRDPALTHRTLYRVFYYTAEPLAGRSTHPVSGVAVDFQATPVFAENSRLIDRLETQPDFAVRRGTVVHQGWQLGRAAVRALMRGKPRVEPRDLVPKIVQKGVDMRIGLDVAALAFKRLVSAIVLVTGDSDLVPAMKLARREGVRVILDPLGSRHIRPELKKHADRVLDAVPATLGGGHVA